jgi:hypothetical protein
LFALSSTITSTSRSWPGTDHFSKELKSPGIVRGFLLFEAHVPRSGAEESR